MLKKIVIGIFVILTLVGIATYKIMNAKNELKQTTYVQMIEEIETLEENGVKFKNYNTTIKLTPIGFKTRYDIEVFNYHLNGKATLYEENVYNWVDIMMNNF